MTKKTQLLGAHMSIAGGLEKSIERGESIGCTAIQIFTHSNRQWHLPTLSESQITLFKTTLAQSTIKSVMVHSSYLINIASGDSALRKKSIQTLQEELKRCEQLEIPYLVMHPGAAVNSTRLDAVQRITEALDLIFEAVPGKSMILLENMAGQGTVMGTTFEELYSLRNEIHHKKRIGYCFDTCHAYSSGYDFGSDESYELMWSLFDDILQLENLKAMHLNDSKTKCGSKVDRHEDIGKGQLGLETFRKILNDKRFLSIPKILETPKGDHPLQDDERNLIILKNLIKSVS